jgi:hypothetical protein
MADSASVKNAAAILGLGLVVGALIGIAVGRSWHSPSLSAPPAQEPGSVTGAESSSKAGVAPSHNANAEDTNVLLGDIATVPFQELYGLLSTLSSEKLADLARQLNALPPGKETNAKIGAFYKAWAHLDAKAALAAAAKLKSTDAKGTAVQAIIEGADPSAASALAKLIQEWPADAATAEQRNGYLASATTKWAQVDPIGAAKFIESLPATGMRFSVAWQIIAQNWAAIDPQAAIAWAQAHSNGQAGQMAMSGAIGGWWDKDHAAAEAYVASHLDTLTDRQLASTLASRIYSQDPQHAKDWVLQLPDAEARRQATYGVVVSMALNDPKGAAAWAATLPSDVRETTLGSAVSWWASNDMDAAGQWINQLSGPQRDEAMGAYSYNLLQKDPAIAASWAVTISDQKIRDKSLERIATDWLSKNPTQATSWIQNSSLSDTEKSRLLALTPGG